MLLRWSNIADRDIPDGYYLVQTVIAQINVRNTPTKMIIYHCIFPFWMSLYALDVRSNDSQFFQKHWNGFNVLDNPPDFWKNIFMVFKNIERKLWNNTVSCGLSSVHQNQQQKTSFHLSQKWCFNSIIFHLASYYASVVYIETYLYILWY